MEFVDGVNLRHLLRERKLSPEEALAIVPPVCEALQYAHGQASQPAHLKTMVIGLLIAVVWGYFADLRGGEVGWFLGRLVFVPVLAVGLHWLIVRMARSTARAWLLVAAVAVFMGLWAVAMLLPANRGEILTGDQLAVWHEPSAAAVRSDGLTFGPVIEKVLRDPDDSNSNETLRLETGDLSSVLNGVSSEGGGRIRRLLASHGDLFVDYDNYVGNRWALITAGLKLSDLAPRQWEDATLSDITTALEVPTVVPHVEPHGAMLYLLPDDLVPMTFAFETREGDRGVLQITGFTDNPRGVRIRYKLVNDDAQ